MAASVDSEIDLDLVVDLDKELVCELGWYTPHNQQYTPCRKPASWVAMVHNEVTTHQYSQHLFCGECYVRIRYKQICHLDEEPLILKARQL